MNLTVDMMGRVRRAAFKLITLGDLSMVVPVSSLEAQHVMGRVLAADDGSPINGAVVQARGTDAL